jgi:hypothetical protein
MPWTGCDLRQEEHQRTARSSGVELDLLFLCLAVHSSAPPGRTRIPAPTMVPMPRRRASKIPRSSAWGCWTSSAESATGRSPQTINIGSPRARCGRSVHRRASTCSPRRRGGCAHAPDRPGFAHCWSRPRTAGAPQVFRDRALRLRPGARLIECRKLSASVPRPCGPMHAVQHPADNLTIRQWVH